MAEITHLFLDIGGVLLTNGWDHNARRRACAKFKLAHAEMERRHSLLFELLETEQITMADYLDQVVFYQKRRFTIAEFQAFMFAQSKPYLNMLRFMIQFKAARKLKVIALSNEALALNAYRIATFGLNHLFDAYISSCYVHVRKPNVQIFQLALDISQANIKEVLYIENTPFFVEMAEQLGIRSLLHKNFSSTRQQLLSL